MCPVLVSGLERLLNKQPLKAGAIDKQIACQFTSAVELALSSPKAEGEIFLAADSEPISVADLVSAMREGLGRSPHLLRVPQGAVKRLMATFGKEAEWERLSGNFVIDAGKIRAIGWQPRVKTYEGIVAMMRAPNGTAPAT